MKLLVTTRADKGIQKWIDLTHPILKKYAARVGADFLAMDHTPPVMSDDNRPHYRITRHYELHEEYDRILQFDSDILLAPDCPNLFELVPYDKIATVYEDKGSRAHPRLRSIYDIQRRYGFIDWFKGYINTGTFLTSKCHRDIYLPHNGEYFTGWGSDDVHLGYMIKKMNYEVQELTYKFNHMTMFSEPWHNSENRFESYAIHYAGRGIFEPEFADSYEQACRDYEIWYGERHEA